MVLLELGRISEHLTVMAEVTLALRHEEHRLLIDCREKIFELFEKFTGHRQGLGAIRLGGVSYDVPPGWIVEYQQAALIIQRTLRLITHSLAARQKFREVLPGGPVDARTILEWSVSGPAMRAAGLNFDLRKSEPCYFYPDVDFDIPVGISGTAYDRFLIRYEEVLQSLRIITQVIDNLPLGALVSEGWNLSVPGQLEKVSTAELAASWHSCALEAPGGEAGFSVMVSPGMVFSRVKVKSPSFTLAQALSALSLGLSEDQLGPHIASLGIRRYELDR
jgi:NADH:ubiquinone oxidoreductase subunit D